MNKEEKFIDYLGKLKNEGNAELLENVISGFKTLVEYRVGGSVAERQVDIMESEDEMVDSRFTYTMADIDNMTLSDILNHLGMTMSDFKNAVEGLHPVEVNEYIDDQLVNQMRYGASDFNDTPLDESSEMEDMGDMDMDDGVSEEDNAIMEVGGGEIKGKVTPAILRQIDNEVEADIRKMASMIDRQKLVSSEDQKVKYLNHMRGEKWRENLLSRDIDPSSVKGLIPAVTESIEEANASLLESVKLMKIVVDKEK